MALTKVQGGVVKDTAQLSITSVNATGVITASSFVGSGANLTDIVSGVGINSAGSVIGTGVTILNFVGSGNTFSYNPATKTVNISIAGGGSLVSKQSFTITSSQSVFNLTNNYDPGMIDVYVNGVRLPSGDFTETSANVVTLVTAAEPGDKVEFIAYSQRVENTVLESSVTNLRVTGVSSVGTGITMTASTGAITATSFAGDGSGLTNLNGFSTPLSNTSTSPLNQIYKTTKTLTVGAGTSVTVEVGSDEGNIAFTKADTIAVAVGATFRIASGTSLYTNVLGVF